MTSKSRSVLPIATAILLASLVVPAAQEDVSSDVSSPDKCVEAQDITNKAVGGLTVKRNTLTAKNQKDGTGAA